jgi:hypothetical protein
MEEILVEMHPPMVSINQVREDRQRIVEAVGSAAPPKAFYARRRLRPNDRWYIEVCKAAPPNGKLRFYTQLVVSMDQIRKDVYAVSKVQPSLHIKCFGLCLLRITPIRKAHCFSSMSGSQQQ